MVVSFSWRAKSNRQPKLEYRAGLFDKSDRFPTYRMFVRPVVQGCLSN
jgi:hypothetical protein